MLLLILLMMVLAAVTTTSMVVTAVGRRRATQASMLWMLAIAVEKRLPIISEIEAYAAGCRGMLRMRAFRLAELLRDGNRLSDALDLVPGLVPATEIMSIRVGEASGKLAEALRESAMRRTASSSLQFAGASSLGYMLLYLGILVLVMLQIVTFLMYWIVPKFRKIFEDFGATLPQTTVMLIEVSDFVVRYFWLVLPLGMLLAWCVFYLLTRVLFGWWKWDPPLLGGQLTRLETPALLRDLARAAEAGRPLTTALEPIAESHRRPLVRSKAQMVVTAIRAGQEAWHALVMAGLLHRREAELLRSADHARNLPWALRTLAEAMERRRLYRLLTAAEFIHPVVVIGLGLVTYVIILGFFLPLIKLIQENTGEVTL